MEKKTYGQSLVGWNTNTYNDPLVGEIKERFAVIIDTLNKRREETTDPEAKRHYSVAITEAQTAQMWAVKAVTWGK